MSERGRLEGIFDVLPTSTLAQCAKLLVGAAAIYLALQFLGFQKLFRDDREGLGALIQIIGTLYSVLYAFATHVIWGQFPAVENEILKESGALKDLILFSNRLHQNTREPIVQAVTSYARVVVESEWRALSNLEGTEKTDRLFNELIAIVTDAKPEDDTQRIVYERLLDIANQASGHRDERLALSVKRMPAHPVAVRNGDGVGDSGSAVLFSVPECGVGAGVDCDYNAAVLRPLRPDRSRQSV